MGIYKYILIILIVLSGRYLLLSQGQSTMLACQDSRVLHVADKSHAYNLGSEPRKALALADSFLLENPNLICPASVRIKASRAYAYERLYKYDEAIIIYNDLIELAKEEHFKDEEIDIYIALARVYEIINRPDLSKNFLDIIAKEFERYDNKDIESHYYVRLSSYHRIYDDKALAKEYAAKALKLGKESGRLGSIAGGNLLLGFLTEDFEESVAYLKECSKYCYLEGDYMGHLFQDLNIAKKYLLNGDHSTALRMLNSTHKEIESLAINEKNYYSTKSYHSELKASVFEALGEKDSQIVALKEVNRYNALFGNLTNQEKINQLILDNALKDEREKLGAAQKRNQRLNIGLLGLGLGLVSLAWLLWKNARNSRKIKEQSSTITSQLSEMQKLYNYQSTLLSEVHHRIKNNLQLIISLLTLQKTKLGNAVVADSFDTLSYRISSISLIHEQLYNLKEFEKVDAKLYVSDLVKNFTNLTMDRHIRFTTDINEIQLNLETMTPLGLIISELISNSIKNNAEKKDLQIELRLEAENETFLFNYLDNGKGYPEGEFKGNNSGIGFTIISSLARQLFADFKTFNNNGAGFTMSFEEKTVSPL